MIQWGCLMEVTWMVVANSRLCRRSPRQRLVKMVTQCSRHTRHEPKVLSVTEIRLLSVIKCLKIQGVDTKRWLMNAWWMDRVERLSNSELEVKVAINKVTISSKICDASSLTNSIKSGIVWPNILVLIVDRISLHTQETICQTLRVHLEEADISPIRIEARL